MPSRTTEVVSPAYFLNIVSISTPDRDRRPFGLESVLRRRLGRLISTPLLEVKLIWSNVCKCFQISLMTEFVTKRAISLKKSDTGKYQGRQSSTTLFPLYVVSLTSKTVRCRRFKVRCLMIQTTKIIISYSVQHKVASFRE